MVQIILSLYFMVKEISKPMFSQNCLKCLCLYGNERAIPGMGKKEKIRNGATHISAKAWSTPMMSTRIFSEMCGAQNTTKQSCTEKDTLPDSDYLENLTHNIQK